jgi:hypothetical protein
MRLLDHAGRKRIVAPNGSEIGPAAKPHWDGPFLKIVARDYGRSACLMRGLYTSVRELSDAEKISKSYVSRVLQLGARAADRGGNSGRTD